jgi:iron complex outermembrane recepter protein
MKTSLLACVSIAGVALGINGAWAQTGGPQAAQEGEQAGGRDVIIVTAQKREEDVQDVPIAISAFSAATLEEAGIKDVRDLRFIAPGLNFATAPQLTNTRVSIRGIGTSGNTAIEPSVGVFVDGVYVPRVGSLLAGLNDISGVEVLRGPQGTLFGRNASMGAINIRTTEPENDLGGELAVLGGDFGRVKTEGKLNLPLTDRIAARFSAVYDTRDGYGVNELTGKDISNNNTLSFRTAASWDITDSLRWVVRADYQSITGDGIPVSTVVKESVTPAADANWRRVLDPDGPTGPLTGDLPILNNTYSLTVRQESEGNLNDRQYGVSSDLSWDLANGYTLRLISGYRDWKNTQYQESTGGYPLGGTPRDGLYISESKSNELQLISPDDVLGGRLNYVAGLYQFEEDFDIGDTRYIRPQQCNVFYRNTRPATQTPTQVNTAVNNCLNQQRAPSSYTNFSQNTQALAAFWQGTFKFTDQWDATAGVRFSKDDKTGVFDQRSFNIADVGATELTNLELSQERTTYRFVTSYKPVPDTMVYASWSTGFKSGGFDSGRNTAVVGQARKFRPETTENVELGIKSVTLDGTLTANAALFQSKVDQYQFRTFDGVSFAVRNNGSIEINGWEWDVTALPTDELTVNISGTYVDSKYSDFRGAPGLPGFGGTQDLTGQRVPYTSEWQINGFARYEQPLSEVWTLALRADFSYTSDQIQSSSGDNDPMVREPDHTIVGARIELQNVANDWSLALAGQNIGNELACAVRFAQPNDANFGLRNAATGSTLYRCSLTAPRTWSLEARKRF